MAKKPELKDIKEKSTGFIGEFKEFIMRGNVMDMAIGVIIGGAFSNIVTALTNDFINPLINGIGGAEVGGSIKIYGGQKILYGDFITAVINFIIMAFVLFLLLKFVNNSVIFTNLSCGLLAKCGWNHEKMTKRRGEASNGLRGCI